MAISRITLTTFPFFSDINNLQSQKQGKGGILFSLEVWDYGLASQERRTCDVTKFFLAALILEKL